MCSPKWGSIVVVHSSAIMRIPVHLHLSRHGIYSFRIVIPRALRETFNGQTEIRRSLGTRNLRQALQMVRPLCLQTYELFAQIEARMSKPEPTVADILAKGRAGELRDLRATKTITLPDGTKHGYDIQTDSNDPAEIAAFERQVDRERAELREAENRYRESPGAVSQALLDYQQKQQAEMAAFKAELVAERAARDLVEARSGVQAIGAPVPQAKPMPAQHDVAAADPEKAPSFKFDPKNVISARWAEYVSQAGSANWAASKTPKANARLFAEFCAWWGKNDDIRAIDRELINQFITYLTTARMVEAGSRKGQPGLNVRTVDNYTSTLNTFLEWAQNKGYFPDNRRLPTEKQTIVKKAMRRARSGKANPAYTLHQLQTLLNPQTFKPDLAHHFWPPFIALYTGGRRREIAQLLVHDFNVIDGIPTLSIDDLGDEDKEVKTEAAKRTIPVHPELIRMGLLEYVADTKALNLGGELFPGIGIDGNGEKGNAIGNAWRRHREIFGMAGEKAPTYHSFRTTAIKVLKAKGVELEIRCQLVGHELDHAGQAYDMTPKPVKMLSEEGTSKLVYDGLDLNGFQYIRGQFDESNRREHVKTINREKRIAAKKARALAAVSKNVALVAAKVKGS